MTAPPLREQPRLAPHFNLISLTLLDLPCSSHFVLPTGPDACLRSTLNMDIHISGIVLHAGKEELISNGTLAVRSQSHLQSSLVSLSALLFSPHLSSLVLPWYIIFRLLIFQSYSITAQLTYGTKYGLVGRNGVGKSTLLKAIASKTVKLPDFLFVVHVEQECTGEEITALDAVLAVDKERLWLIEKEKYLVRVCVFSTLILRGFAPAWIVPTP